jgi:putative transposase
LTTQAKGKVERLPRTITDSFVAGLPCWTGGPRDHRGQLEAPGAPLALAELVARFDAWVQAYNAARPHRSLGGQTPLARWTADPTPLRLVAPEDARRLLTARRSARVRRDGVHRGGLAYIAVELTELVGDDVELAFSPHDLRSVDIYWRGAWLCTAHPHDVLSRDEQQRILAERRAYADELRRRQRRARRRAKSRLAPATSQEPAPAEITRLPEQARASTERGARREEALRAAARTDLLLPGAGPPRARR